MSRVGKNPVEVPSGVEIAIQGGLVSAKGKLGSLEFRATVANSSCLIARAGS